MELSGLGQEIKEMQGHYFKETSETCVVHDVKLIKPKSFRPFCPICAKERAAKDEESLLETETEKAYKTGQKWLKSRSVVLDKEMFKMTFENFNEMDEETSINKEMALDMARSLYKGSTRNEMLAGRFGTGKTHLAMAILNQLNSVTDMKLVFVSIDELMRRIKGSFGNPESPYREDVVVKMLSDADVVVIDDLGAEVGSVDRNSEATDYNVRTLNAILNGRANKPTVFTTNLTIPELRETYDGRILSRVLRGMEQERIIQFVKTTDKRSEIQF